MQRVVTIMALTVMVFILIVGCGQKKTQEQLYAEAFRYEQDENFDQAIETFEVLIKTYPQSEVVDSVLFRIGQIYSNNIGDFKKSVLTHERLIQHCPTSRLAAQSLFMIGYHFANSISDLDSARIYYQKFIDSYPDHELVNSVKWELDHLGQDINEIDLFKQDPAGKN